MIKVRITGNPFAADETVLGLFHAAIKDLAKTGARSCTALVNFEHAGVKARFRISVVNESTGTSRRERRPG